MTNGKQDDARLKAYKARTRAIIDSLRADLKGWIRHHDGGEHLGDPLADPTADLLPARNDFPVTSALHETAIDRLIHVLGEQNAREIVMLAFERRAKAMRQRLH